MNKWRLTINRLLGKDMYRPYKLVNEEDVDHSGNRTYHGGYIEDKQEAQQLVDKLNEEG